MQALHASGLEPLILATLVKELAAKGSLHVKDKIVTRYMDDKEFGSAAFAVLSKAIYDSIPPVEAAGQLSQ